MADKPVHLRADIHMLLWSNVMNPSSNKQILPETLTLGCAALLVPVVPTGHQRQLAGIAPVKPPQVAQKKWNPADRAQEMTRGETELA